MTDHDLIHCFKEGQPCFQGHEVLRSQLMILQDEGNPFDPSESDVEEAYESCQLLDQGEEDDKDIDLSTSASEKKKFMSKILLLYRVLNYRALNK